MMNNYNKILCSCSPDKRTIVTRNIVPCAVDVATKNLPGAMYSCVVEPLIEFYLKKDKCRKLEVKLKLALKSQDYDKIGTMIDEIKKSGCSCYVHGYKIKPSIEDYVMNIAKSIIREVIKEIQDKLY